LLASHTSRFHYVNAHNVGLLARIAPAARCVNACYNARMDDRTLRKALRLSIHPVTLVAIGLLLINDHLLRRIWPSALTGKLGDFAWLFFIPLLLAVLVALVLPGRGPRRAAAVGWLAFGSVAVVFVAAKTVPVAHETIVALAERVLGFTVGWRRDPTDLVGLIALVASAALWARTPEPACGRIELAAPGWAALIMAALLTVANAPAPDPGIYCLEERDGEVLAFAGYTSYRSTDGGLTWERSDAPPGSCPSLGQVPSGAPVTALNPNNDQRRYRFEPGLSIEFSDDGGATWRTVYHVENTSEAVAAATQQRLTSSAELRPTPIDARIDRRTGNAVFAMGHAGVLVYDSSGVWQEIPVGNYSPVTVSGAFDFFQLLVGEILLAVGLALLGFNVLASRAIVRGRTAWIIALIVAGGIWAAVAFVFPPALTYGYGSFITYAAMLVLGLILLIATAIALVKLLQEGAARVWRPLLICLAGGVLFLLPYALWAADTLPRYTLAAAFGTLLGVAAIAGGSRWALRNHSAAR